MIVFPNGKINLGLRILGRRADGFHDLETLFYPLPLQDALEIIQSPDGSNQFHVSGIPLDLKPEHNICAKAWQLLKKDYPELPPVHLHLHKIIPTGAGLGGGSADGAFTLLLLNKKFGLQIPQNKLLSYALHLGSDCPFFLMNKPCYAKGRGEILDETGAGLGGYHICLVHPGIHISTAWAFSQIKPVAQGSSVRESILLPVEEWKHHLINDFEAVVFPEYPAIHDIKKSFYDHGAVYAAMSGSGSAVFGLFPEGIKPIFSFPPNYFFRWIT